MGMLERACPVFAVGSPPLCFHLRSWLTGLGWPRLTVSASLFLGNPNDDPTLTQCQAALVCFQCEIITSRS